MKQCSKGHVYADHEAQCPYCNGSKDSHTVPLYPGAGAGVTAGIDAAAGNFPKTMPVGPTMGIGGTTNDKMGNTEQIGTGVTVVEKDARPAVGWLVVVSEEKRGTSFPIYPHMNYVGRGSKFEVNLGFDKTVSSSGDATISYDPTDRSFDIKATETTKNLSYLNGIKLRSAQEIKDYDKIKIGQTLLIFRSFCNAEHDYTDYEN